MPATSSAARSSLLDSVRPTHALRVELRGENPRERQQPWLTEAVSVSVHHERGIAKRLADALGVGINYVYQLANINDAKPLRAFEIPALVRESGSFAVLDAIEAQLGRVAFQIPVAASAEHVDVVAYTALTVREFGDVLAKISAAMADGTITDDERAQCEREIADVHAALAALQIVIAKKAAA